MENNKPFCEKRLRKNAEESFDKWFDEYFCNQQGEDSPYSYNDVHMAFLKGWKEGEK